jgi:hypothetical protein
VPGRSSCRSSPPATGTTTSLERVAELSAWLERPQVEHWFAEMLIARWRPEDRARARTVLDAAVDHYDEMGIRPHRERAQRVLDAL